MNPEELFKNLNARVVRLDSDAEIKPFESGDNDLDNFLLNDAKDYQNSLLSVTYIIQSDSDTIAYYCLSNDRLSQYMEEKRQECEMTIREYLKRYQWGSVSIPSVTKWQDVLEYFRLLKPLGDG